jgi:N-acetyl-anhydromuramyl-L-alanine amidase AmpD
MALDIRQIGCASQNFRRGRPEHLQIDACVIHLIDGSQAGADAVFCSPDVTVKRSAHYSISKSGRIHQYVDEQDTAYHCGVIDRPTWQGLKRAPDGSFINPNYYTIGIEHEGRPGDPWPEAMYDASADLLRDISLRYPALRPLTRRNVVMHREIRASKSCPGYTADLTRLITQASDQSIVGPRHDEPQMFRARTAVNVRKARPSTSAPVVRVIPPGELLNVRARVTGESVNGVSVWYENMDGDYIWGGAVVR